MKNVRLSAKQYARSIKSALRQNTVLATGVLVLGISPWAMKSADAQVVQLGDWTAQLQSTLQYTGALRTAPVDNELVGLNTDDGDRNFRSGLVANRFQTLEQFKISKGDYGLRASAEAWIDTVYLQNNKNNSPYTVNQYSAGPQGFASGTVANEGRRIEPLALFVYGAENFGSGAQRLSWQVGRQTITWGESLFTLNGLSGLQAPADFYQAELLPNPQAQAVFLPTGAASFSYDTGTNLTLDAYWKFEYEPDILPGVGSYFSSADLVGPGAQRILFSPNPGAVAAYRGPDVRPNNGLDQFGIAAHYITGNYQFGLYGIRGIPPAPSVYTDLSKGIYQTPQGTGDGNYYEVYAQPVNAAAASVTTTVLNAVNVAGEISFKNNQPLSSSVTIETPTKIAYSHPLYAAGNVITGLANAIYLTPPLPLFKNGMTLEAETVFSQVVSINYNSAAITPGKTREGGTFEVVATPNWFPISTVEIETPVGWTTTYVGKSQYLGSSAGTGTIDLGILAIYKQNLQFLLNYQRYYGSPNQEALLDRDFLEFQIQKTF